MTPLANRIFQIHRAHGVGSFSYASEDIVDKHTLVEIDAAYRELTEAGLVVSRPGSMPKGQARPVYALTEVGRHIVPINGP